jgi:glycosyltransferase involved in cell wall biosynthesis
MCESPTNEQGAPIIGGRLRVIFVGGFGVDGVPAVQGGQLTACRSLIGSPISKEVTWYLIDSMMRSLPKPAFLERLCFAWRRMLRFASVLALEQVDTVLLFSSSGASFLEKGLMAMAAAQLGKRVVFAPRSGHMRDFCARSWLIRFFARVVFRECSKVLCQSASWRHFYRELTGLPDSRMDVIVNWIELAGFYHSGRRNFDRAPVFLFLGWIVPAKGIFDLIAAVAARRRDLSGARIVICGQGSGDIELRELVTRFGLQDMVEVRGWVAGEAKLAAFRDADVFVLPSHAEGMPNSLIEAMAAGLAVIATPVGGIPEIVRNRDLGRVFPPGDVSALGDCLVELCQDKSKRRTLGENAARFVRENHDVLKLWPKVLFALNGSSDRETSDSLLRSSTRKVF